MGCCLSTQPFADDTNPVPNPSPYATPFTTHMVAVNIPHSRCFWNFSFRLNMEPITIGQRVALYEMGIDAPEPDPDEATPAVKGWIGSVMAYGPDSVTFSVINSAGERVAQLFCPDYPTPQLLYVNSHPPNPTHPHPACKVI